MFHTCFSTVVSTNICSYSLTPLFAIKKNRDPIASAVHKHTDTMNINGNKGNQMFSHKKRDNTMY